MRNDGLSDNEKRKLDAVKAALRKGRLDLTQGGRSGPALGALADAGPPTTSATRELERFVPPRRPAVMRISHRDPELLIETPGGQRERLYTDNRGASVSALGGEPQQVTTAGWEAGALVVETTRGGGATLSERFRLHPQPRQLWIFRDIQLDVDVDEPLSIRSVYEPAQCPDALGKDCRPVPGP